MFKNKIKIINVRKAVEEFFFQKKNLFKIKFMRFIYFLPNTFHFIDFIRKVV